MKGPPSLIVAGLIRNKVTLCICYAWPHRPPATQADYSITVLLFVMHGHTGPQPTQADYNTTILLFVIHGHTGPHPPRLTTA